MTYRLHSYFLLSIDAFSVWLSSPPLFIDRMKRVRSIIFSVFFQSMFGVFGKESDVDAYLTNIGRI
jgi:hypothetical protein